MEENQAESRYKNAECALRLSRLELMVSTEAFVEEGPVGQLPVLFRMVSLRELLLAIMPVARIVSFSD